MDNLYKYVLSFAMPYHIVMPHPLIAIYYIYLRSC